MRFLGGIRRAIVWLSWVVAGISLLGLCIAVLAAILDRYLFKVGLAWPEEVGRLLLVWLSFAGAVIASDQGKHFAVGNVAASPSSLGGLIWSGVLKVITLALLVFLGLQARVLIEIVGGQVMAGLDVSIIWLYVPLMIFAFAMAVVEIIVFVQESWLGKKSAARELSSPNES